MSSGYARLIPERTIDSLFAAEAIAHVPATLIWSPSNTANSWDHELFHGTDVGIFEAKGVLSDAKRDPLRTWRIPIRLAQLNYFANLTVDVLYLLPVRPERPRTPWLRRCNLGACAGSAHCWCCQSQAWPARRMVGDLPHIARAPLHVRLQPWACHWIWVVPARCLRRHPQLAQSGPGEPTITADDAAIAALPNATRLCHWLSATDLFLARIGERPFGLTSSLELDGFARELEAALQYEVNDAYRTQIQIAGFS